VKRLGNFGFFPHLEIGRLEETPAEILDKLDKAPLQEKLKQIKAVPKGELDTLLPNGNTLLHQAVIRHDLTFAEALLEAGAKVDSKNESDRTPLALAAVSRHQDMSLLLMRKGADISLVEPDHTPMLLRYALNKHELPLIDKLLASGVRLSEPDLDREFSAMISFHQRDMLQLFVKHGFNIAEYCARGFTPLIDAIPYEAGHPGCAMLEYLLQQGAPVDQIDARGYSALTFSAEHRCVDAMGLLIAVGANVDSKLPDGRSVLRVALAWGEIEVAKRLLQAGAAAMEEERRSVWDQLKTPSVQQ
jgi:ankyrin repeat protein